MPQRFCGGPDCEQSAVVDGLCWSHHKQRERGKPLAPIRRYGSARDRVQALIAAYYTALDGPEEGVRRAWKALTEGMKTYTASTKPTDPRGGGGRR